MSSITTTVARQYRLQEWASQISECQRRPQNLTVKDWCIQHQITVANYYYRLRQVREACLEEMTSEVEPQAVVAVPEALIEHENSSSESNYKNVPLKRAADFMTVPTMGRLHLIYHFLYV